MNVHQKLIRIIFKSKVSFILFLLIIINGHAQGDVFGYSRSWDDTSQNTRDIRYHKNTEQPKRIIIDGIEHFYNLKGNLLGKLELKYENLTNLPWNGERFTFDGDGRVTSVIRYQRGTIVKKTSFRYRLVSKGVFKSFKEIVKYGPDGYSREKLTSFYSYGGKQSEIIYELDRKVLGRYFDKNGTEIGIYDFLKQNGTRYGFFDKSDNVQYMKIYREGKLKNSKLFIEDEQTEYSRIQPVLIYEFDVSCCAKFYSNDGKIIGDLIYKSEKPWDGTAFDREKGTKYTYKEGLLNGDFEKQNDKGDILEVGQYKGGLKAGLFKYYSSSVLRKTETYLKGKLHGVSIIYDESGEEISRMNYQNDKKFNGNCLAEPFADQGKKITRFKDGEQLETLEYYKNSNQKKLRYTIQNSVLHGGVMRFDKNGILQYKATLSNGKLVSGTLLLRPVSSNRKISNIKLTRFEDKMTVVAFDINGRIVFQAEQNMTSSTNFDYIKGFNENLSIISDYRLF